MTTPHYLTGDRASIDAFIDRFHTFLFDCDGVLWTGEYMFPKVPEVLGMLRQRGKHLLFVTNNSTRSRVGFKQKFDAFGIACKPEEIISSSYSASLYISRILNLPAPKNKVLVLGESGVEEELRAENIPFIGGTDPSFRRQTTSSEIEAIADGSALDPDVAVVLVGLDFSINYLKLALALAYLQRGAIFLATNTNNTVPMAHSFFPGTGSIVAFLEKASKRKSIDLGKPGMAMMQAIEKGCSLDREGTCMVGDRLETDIRFGNEGGLGGTLAVLSGVCKAEDFLYAEKRDARDIPSAYLDRIGDILACE